MIKIGTKEHLLWQVTIFITILLIVKEIAHKNNCYKRIILLILGGEESRGGKVSMR